MQARPAVFLDRDGTLTEARSYPRSPDELVLQLGIAPWLRALRRAGFALVVVTNQSGLARGLFGWRELRAMHLRMRAELAELSIHLDGIYVCPHHPEGSVATLAVRCACRKPAPGLLCRAADDLGLDLRRSWMIGDFTSDVAAGKRAGCRTALVASAGAVPDTRARDAGEPDLRGATTADALRQVYAVLRHERGPAATWHGEI
jgi:D-glycero-D-manno-heptose 1,7-bisphosphate phosphatase